VWKAIYQYVFSLAHGGATKELFYYGDWIRNQVLRFIPVTKVFDL